MANETETPAETLQAATVEKALPMHRMTLVGTFDKAEGPSALIRTPEGGMHMLSRGEKIGTATVTAIEMGSVRLSLGDHSAKLTLPGHAAEDEEASQG